MLGKRGIAGIAFVATALLAGGTASANNYTGIVECKTQDCTVSESLLRVPYGTPLLLGTVSDTAAQACPSPVRIPLGQDEIVLCEESSRNIYGSDVSLVRVELDGRETELRMASSGSALTYGSEISLRTGDEKVKVETVCSAYPDPTFEQGECLP